MSNEAAWISEPCAPIKVGPAPMPTPGSNEIVVRVHSVAINPMEAMIQKMGVMLEEFPAILGSDGAGVVHAVGSSVKNLAPGDRVMACFDGVPPFPRADYRRVSYQRYAVAQAHLASKIPDSVPFTDACVLPLCISSSSEALFSERGMQLPAPKFEKSPQPNGKTIVVWGGSSSVGTSAIQLLISDGYEVGAVAGAKNHELCRSLGVEHVFDHSSPTVVDDVVKAFKGTNFQGIFSAIMTKEALEPVIDIYVKLGSRGKLGSIMPPGMPVPCEVPSGVDVRRAHGSYMATSNLGLTIWSEWIPAALNSGSLQFVPKPSVYGKGLDRIQGAIDRYMEGVSGQKVVVELE